jgi:hypothetical protein
MRPLWLPQIVYEALPIAYVAVGSIFVAAAFLSDVGPHALLLVLGGLCVTGGLVIWMRRRDYRATQAEYRGRPLDE